MLPKINMKKCSLTISHRLYASHDYPTDDNNFLLRVFNSPALIYVTYQRQLTVDAATD